MVARRDGGRCAKGVAVLDMKKAKVAPDESM